MRIASVHTALPSHRYTQERLFEALGQTWHSHPKASSFAALRKSTQVQARHLALPLERYFDLASFGDANNAFLAAGLDLGEAAMRGALDKARLPADALAHIFSVTVTGIATPTLEARLANRLGLNRNVKRTPIFGLGCVAGASGLARAADYLKAYPEQAVALLSVELCTLTFQKHEMSAANLIASSLFADGSAAVILTGSARPSEGPRVLDSRAFFYHNTEDAMGWNLTDTGFNIVLSRDIPKLIQAHVRADVDSFLASNGLTRADLDSYIMHPGGPKILTSIQEALEIPESALQVSWDSLRSIGNLSSASVLSILQDTWEGQRPTPGSHSLLGAMGPGFCSEWVLLRW